MTRGRKKDLTIPPTRSLVQQRDYRARKANYVATLEECLRKAEEENIQLRNELMQTRARLATPSVILPETAEASKELMQSLALASASLSKFQQLAFATAQSSNEASSSRTQTTHETQLHHQTSPVDDFESPHTHRANTFGRKKLFFSHNTPPFSPVSQTSPIPASRSQSPESGSECCGGIIDCDALGSDGVIEEEAHTVSTTRSRLSGLRSTSMAEYRQ